MAGVTNAQVTAQMTSLLASWNTREAQHRAWLGGTATGGPNGDGRYPLTNSLGVTYLVDCPAKLASDVNGPTQLALSAADAAQLARDGALSEANRSAAERELAETARDASVAARNLSQTYRDQAGTHAANAQSWAGEAGTARGDLDAALQTVEDHRLVTEAKATEATDAAAEAAASAAAAATFDPALYTLNADAIAASRITGVLDVDRIPVLPSQRQFTSSGDLTALTGAQQAEIGQGSIVTVQDGTRYVYSGSGSKTLASSYIVLADVTPDWTTISGKPATYASTIAEVSGLQAALDARLPLTGGTVSGSIVANALYGILQHTSGYFVMQPFSASYDDGSYFRAYYDGNASRLLLSAVGGNGVQPRIYLNGRGYVHDDTTIGAASVPAIARFSTPTAFTRHQTAYGYIDFGPANAGYAHIYTDRPTFYFNAPILVNGNRIPAFTASTGAPSGGADGDLHITY